MTPASELFALHFFLLFLENFRIERFPMLEQGLEDSGQVGVLPLWVTGIAVQASRGRRVHRQNPPESLAIKGMNWSERRDSNPRHSRWQRDALPTELRSLPSRQLYPTKIGAGCKPSFYFLSFFRLSGAQRHRVRMLLRGLVQYQQPGASLDKWLVARIGEKWWMLENTSGVLLAEGRR